MNIRARLIGKLHDLVHEAYSAPLERRHFDGEIDKARKERHEQEHVDMHALIDELKP